jgi:SAM-dependent methyltransferase
MAQTLDRASPPAAGPGRILDLSWGIARTGALTAALDLDVFSHLAAGARTADAVAARAGADPDATATLLTCLASIGLVEAGEGPSPGYALAADAEAFLVRDSPSYLGDLRHMHHELNFRIWPGLARAVREGGPAQDLFGDDGSDVWTRVTPYLDQLAEASAAWLTKMLAGSLPADARILDIGCGSGAYSRLLARTSADVRVTAIDRPDVLERALRLAAGAGLDDQIEGRPGDLREVDWGAGYDLVLLSNLLHGYDEPDAVELLTRSARALAPGGRVAVLEFVIDPERPLDNAVAAFFSLQMLMTSGGRAYTLDEYGDQLRRAGLGAPTVTRSPGPSTLLTAALAP